MPDLSPWLRIKARFEAGEAIPMHVRRMAEAVLDERFIRLGKASRPDRHDRAAGDDSFDDDQGMVPL
jgi:hypothetical protein